MYLHDCAELCIVVVWKSICFCKPVISARSELRHEDRLSRGLADKASMIKCIILWLSINDKVSRLFFTEAVKIHAYKFSEKD